MDDAVVGTRYSSESKRASPIEERAEHESQNEADYGGRPATTSFRQIAANRRNAGKSTGPITNEGKQRSRCNAVSHGLTAETAIGCFA